MKSAWQLGTRWGDPFNEAEAMKILEASYDSGINLIDTADIYNDGNSEKAIGKFLKSHKDHFFVVTKCGRGLNPRVAEGYTPENMEAFIDGSLRRHSRGKQTGPGSLQRPGRPAPGAYPGANGRGRGHLQPIHPPLRPPKLVNQSPPVREGIFFNKRRIHSRHFLLLHHPPNATGFPFSATASPGQSRFRSSIVWCDACSRRGTHS